MAKIRLKKKARVVVTCIACTFIMTLAIITSFSNLAKITEKSKEKKQLINKLENLQEETKILKDDVEKLKNPEYAARYAREKYLYSKTGEKIIKID